VKNESYEHTLNTRSGTQAYSGTLGTFAGVFTPSVLTILGIILFLRLGYVVGNAGLGRALLILLLANGISVLTSVSLSAIATNLKVKGGGDYYLISRTLGHEFGGALGIVLFLAQSVSIAFYCLGFGEAVAQLIHTDLSILPQIIAAMAVSFLFVFAWLGADWATRFQFVVMAVLFTAILSFFIGGFLHWDSGLLAQNWTSSQTDLGFWIIFAIFFPAVTGFTQGVSMSGDLKDPGKSLPAGTFAAVGLSIVVYFISAILFAASLPGEVLASDYSAMSRVAYFGILVTAGVIAATLSSAMASFLGAPRILQSLAADRIFPFLDFFAKGSGPSSNPRRAVLLAAGIAYATVSYGRLNLIAPVVSMFFLISYGLLNYATYYEASSQSPSFRPRFRYFNKWLSLAGALACLGAMLAVDLAAGIVAVAVLFSIFQYLKYKARPARWAASRRSHHLQQIREHLIAAAAEPEHPRDWRPQILAFSDNPERRKQLMKFASWIEGGSGLTTLVQVIEGEGVKMRKEKEEAEKQLRQDLAKDSVQAFALVVVAPTLNSGIQSIVQSYGVGALRANTILLNWLGQSPHRLLGWQDQKFGRNLRTARFYGCNLIILDAKADKWKTLTELEHQNLYIDVWWCNDASSRLMLLMAYLMTRSHYWSSADIRLMAVKTSSNAEQDLDDIKHMLAEVRIEAEPALVENADADTIAEYSSDAALVFLPFRLKENRVTDPFGNPMEDTLFLLPVTAMVMAAEDIDLDVEPEEGEAGASAQLLDALDKARKLKAETAKEAEEAAAAAQKAQNKYEGIKAGDEAADPEAIEKTRKAAEEAEELADKLARRSAKAAAKAETAAREAEDAGILPDESEKE
jgi:amino acid transporter